MVRRLQGGALGVALWLAVPSALPLQRPAQQADDAASQSRRSMMVDRQIYARGVTDQAVLDAMAAVPRHRFVPDTLRAQAYADRALPIGLDQTISQPFIVAHMTEALGVSDAHDVLEIGTGSGYQAAVLSQLARNVYTIEIVPALARRAAATLKALGYANVYVGEGDGYAGWPEHAPFGRIMVTAAPARVPPPLIDQLAAGGRMVIPVGEREQWMTIIEKTPEGVAERRTIPVMFVPFTRR